MPASEVDSGAVQVGAEQLSVVTLATTALVHAVVLGAPAQQARIALAAVKVLARVHAHALPSLCDPGSDAMSSIRVVVFDGLRRIVKSNAAVAAVPMVVNVWRGVELVEPTATPDISALSTVDLVRRYNELQAALRSAPAKQVQEGRGLDAGTPGPPGCADVDVTTSGTVGVQEQELLEKDRRVLRKVLDEVGIARHGLSRTWT